MAAISKDKQKKLDEALKGINKKYGEGTIAKVSDSLDKLEKRFIPTPSIELNNALNCKGFAGIVELYGSTGSGKTSLAIETVALAQKNDPEFVAAWLETEGSVTVEILQAHGVDLDRLIYWRQEDVGNAESALEVSRALIFKGVVDMMVVNSIAGLAPKVETEDDLEKQNIALVARLLSKYFRGITGAASKNNITLIFINQVRDNVGVMFGDTSTTTGGKSLGFYSSQRVKMNRNKVMAADPILEEEGVKVSCIIHKNRFAGLKNPFTKCIYYARYATGIDSIVNIPSLLLEAGLVRQAGAWWYYEDENGQPLTIEGELCKFGSKNKFIDCLRANDKFREYFAELLSDKSTVVSDEELQTINKEAKEIESTMAAIVEGAEEE